MARHAALEHDRQARPADFLEQAEILHVARADLEAIGVFLDHLELLGVHDLGDHRQAGRFARLGEELEALEAEPLESVGRGARLESAAAQNAPAGLLDLAGDADDLLAALDAARAAHQHHLLVADGDVADLHVRMIAAAEFAGDELVGLEHRRHAFDPGNGRERLHADGGVVADHPDHRAHLAPADVGLKAPLLDPLDDVGDLGLRGPWIGDDDHEKGRGQ